MGNKYFYPKLSTTDLGLFRIGGPGLANCMFFAAKAYVKCKNEGGKYISPTWNKFSIGPYIRREFDKRSYMRMFRSIGVDGFRKELSILLNKCGFLNCEIFDHLGDYFTDLQPHQQEVASFFESIVFPHTICKVDGAMLADKVAIHVRLGDYLPQLRVPIEWYKGIVLEILKQNPNQEFILFSDGRDEELKLLLDIPMIKRAFFGNAFADMWGISKCKVLIASDSTFSAWGAFLGNVPIIFNRRHFPPVYPADSEAECVVGNETSLPVNFAKYFG